MGDRSNPMKFGPEWLRNMPRTGTQTNRNNSGSGSTGAPPPRNGSSTTTTSTSTSNTNTSKVLLAKLRYGREEMLALYETRQNVESPPQLRQNNVLYQSRSKPPYALNIEEETRDMRGQSAVGGLANQDRYGISRGRSLSIENRGRALTSVDVRGRGRGYSRQSSLGGSSRGTTWNPNARNLYSGVPDDDPSQSSLRPWASNPPPAGPRPAAEQAEWANRTTLYRNKRHTTTNWRQQQNREEGEEWRSAEGPSTSRRQHDKWGNEWPTQDKPWSTNRRTRSGDTAEDGLPEWAVDNAEACGGTFDSSGAFHDYSNDDSNIPKNVEPYALTRSHTHGSFSRSKTAEEGSEEWWASEKAKKLSSKRFDASEIKFKKPGGEGTEERAASSASGTTSSSASTSTGAIPKIATKAAGYRANNKDKNNKPRKSSLEEKILNDALDTEYDKPERDYEIQDRKKSNSERLHEPEVNDKPSDEKGNFQSVILKSNNILRQKHQNIGTPTESPKKQTRLLQYYHSDQSRLDREKALQNDKENQIVEDILQMSLDENIPQAMSELLNHSTSRISPGLVSSVNSMTQMPGQNMAMSMTTSVLNQQSSGMQGGLMPQMGMTNSVLAASLGLHAHGLPQPLSNTGMLPSSLHNRGMSSNLQANLPSGQSTGLSSGLPVPGLQSGSGLQGHIQSGLQSNGLPSQNITGIRTNNLLLNVGNNNNSLFLNQGSTNNTLPNSNDIGNQGNNQNMFPLHGLSSSSSQPFNAAVFSNLMSHPPPPLGQNLFDQWYYEDPNKTIQGPFSSKEMSNWLRAGFFSPNLMVRRAYDHVMRPLYTYGFSPFEESDPMTSLLMGGPFAMRPPQPQENHGNPQLGLGLDVPTSMGMPTMPFIRRPHVAYNPDNHNQLNIRLAIASMSQYRGLIPNSIGEQRPLPPPIPMPIPHQTPEPIMPEQNNRVESVWGQPANNSDMLWMQDINNPRNENRGNNSQLYFWDQQGLRRSDRN